MIGSGGNISAAVFYVQTAADLPFPAVFSAGFIDRTEHAWYHNEE